MPLSPEEAADYPDGATIDSSNLFGRGGCDSVLSTTTVQADGTIGACCGISLRLIPELQLGHVSEVSINQADQLAQRDFLKRWIRVDGPERILAWAATIDPEIRWEGLYSHRCQACLRLYSDARVRRVIREHYREKAADVLFAEWLLHAYTPDAETEGSIGGAA
jgi:hypothetical protein